MFIFLVKMLIFKDKTESIYLWLVVIDIYFKELVKINVLFIIKIFFVIF